MKNDPRNLQLGCRFYPQKEIQWKYFVLLWQFSFALVRVDKRYAAVLNQRFDQYLPFIPKSLIEMCSLLYHRSATVSFPPPLFFIWTQLNIWKLFIVGIYLNFLFSICNHEVLYILLLWYLIHTSFHLSPFFSQDKQSRCINDHNQ